MWMWWLTVLRCEMWMWEVEYFPCLSRGFSVCGAVEFLNVSLLIQMVFLLATVFLALLQNLVSHALECSLQFTHLILCWLWELLEDCTKLVNLVHWPKQVPSSPVHFRTQPHQIVMFDNIKLFLQSVWSWLVCSWEASSTGLCTASLWSFSALSSFADTAMDYVIPHEILCITHTLSPRYRGIWLVISWLCICSSPLIVPIMSPSSSSPLFPHKSH